MAEREPVTGDVIGGRYEIQSELGRGGMATVYRGRDLRLQRRVAVKVFRDGFAESVDPQRRTQEMQLLASVNHPSVVAVLDASTGDGVFGAYLVMELVVGDDLGALLHRARGPLTADFARRIVADVAGALQTLHANGVVHRDVKPANILVPSTAASPSAAVAAKLTDFGIAQLVDAAAVTSPETILGTAAYLSPEQVRGAPPRPASDVYSLGLVLLEALTGARAFPGAAAEAAMARLHRPPALPPGASPALADLLSRMTALDPAHRPSAADVALALRHDLVGGVLAPDATITAPTPIAGVPAPLALHQTSRGPDQTAPHEPLWTPSRGMPLATGGIRTTGAVRTAGVGTTGSTPVPVGQAPRRRFPAVLAITASALAAAVAAVAISAAAGTGASPSAAGTGTHRAAVSAPAPAATEEDEVTRTTRDLTSQQQPVVPRSPKPTRSASTPTPTPTPSAPVPTTVPTTAAPIEDAPSALPVLPPEAPSAPPSSEAPAAPPSSTAPSSVAPEAPAPAAPPPSVDPSANSTGGAVQQDVVVAPQPSAAGDGSTT